MQNNSIFENIYPVLIVTEDTDSACSYLQSRIKDLGLSSGKLAIVSPSTKGSSPNKVLESAISLAETHNKNTKWNGQLPYKKVYCVMDVDNHTTLPKTLDKIRNINATQKKTFELIEIVSNECFEVWYVLHFRELGDSSVIKRPSKKGKNQVFVPENENYEKILERNGIKYAKTSDLGKDIFEMIKDYEDKAIKNSEWLLNSHANIGFDTTWFPNPSTQVHLLIQDLKKMSNLLKGEKEEIDATEVDISDLKPIQTFNDDFALKVIDIVNEEYAEMPKQERIDMLNPIFENYHNSILIRNDCNSNLSSYFWANYQEYQIK